MLGDLRVEWNGPGGLSSRSLLGGGRGRRQLAKKWVVGCSSNRPATMWSTFSL